MDGSLVAEILIKIAPFSESPEYGALTSPHTQIALRR
jgi:hypothetical protein